MKPITISALALAVAACGQAGDARTGPAASAAAVPVEAASVMATPESRTFRDWYAVCDNTNACAAYAGASAGWILISLEAGPDARPTVRAGMWPEGESLEGPLTIVIDGRQHPVSPDPDNSAHSVVAPEHVPALLADLAKGRSVRLVAGAQSLDVPAAGVSASLLWMDERQGRLDTVTALIRRGDRPASSVPAAPAPPVITAAAAVSQDGLPRAPRSKDFDQRPKAVAPAALEALPSVKHCRADTAFNPYLQEGVTVDRLGPETELWGVPCDGGAYNFSSAFFITEPGGANPRPIAFPGLDGRLPTNAEGRETALLVNPIYDAEKRVMTAFAKGRGMGDCGVLQSWTWTGQAFVLSREQIMEDCWGMPADLWPTKFRSR